MAGDGKADLVAKERTGAGNWYVAKSLVGGFQPQPNAWLSGWAVASGAYELFVADVNNDHKADLVARERGAPGRWYVASSNGGQFVAQAVPALDP